MHQSTEDEASNREKAMQEGLKKAVTVPFNLAEKAAALLGPLSDLAGVGNINCKSDLQVSTSKSFQFVKFKGHLSPITTSDRWDLVPLKL